MVNTALIKHSTQHAALTLTLTHNKLSTYLQQSVVLLLWTMRWYRYNQECMIEGRKEERRMRVKWTWVTILNDLLLGVSPHPAIKRKSQIIQLHMHVHVASSPALQTHDENSLLLFLQLDRRSLEMRPTQTLHTFGHKAAVTHCALSGLCYDWSTMLYDSWYNIILDIMRWQCTWQLT